MNTRYFSIYSSEIFEASNDDALKKIYLALQLINKKRDKYFVFSSENNIFHVNDKIDK
jgi:hypothetical protein